MPKAKNDLPDELKTVIDEAEATYDLRARLAKGATRITETVTVYTDRAVGKELGGAEPVYESGINIGRRRWGVLGEIDLLEEEAKSLLKRAEAPDAPDLTEEAETLKKELAALKRKVAPLRKKLEASSLTFTLHAIPDFVKRDARRKAKKAIGLKGKGIPQDEEIQEDYNLAYNAVVLAASVEKYVDNESGVIRHSLDFDEAKALQDLLPPGQFDRLDRAVVDLSFKAQIGNHATDSADF